MQFFSPSPLSYFEGGSDPGELRNYLNIVIRALNALIEFVTGNTVASVSNVAQMQAFPIVAALAPSTVYVQGYTTPGDRGGGTFIWEPTSTATVDNGTVFASSSSATGRWVRVNYDFLIPEMFGAAGDDVTDDTTAIQNTLNTGQLVKLASTYHTTSAVRPLSGQTIFSDSNSAYIRCTGDNTNTIQLSGRTNVTIRGVYSKFQGAYNSGNNGAAIYIPVGASENSVQGCRVEGTGGGITIGGDKNRIFNNLVSTTGAADCQWDIAVYNSGNENVISGNQCYGDQSRVGIVIQANLAPCTNNVITNNVIINKGQYGIVLYSNSNVNAVLHTICSGNRVDTITGLYNNQGTWAVIPGDNVFGAGIYVQSADYTSVIGNVVSNTNTDTNADGLSPAAIGCSGTSIITIVGNVVDTCSWYGISLNSGYSVGFSLGGSTISGNTVNLPGRTGIRVKDQANVSVTGNVVTNGSAQGIVVDGDLAVRAGVVVSANVANTCSDVGIEIDKMTAITVTGNKSIACLRGIVLSNCVDGIITGNEVRSSTGTSDVQVDNSNSGNILFDKNIVKSTAATGVLDQIGMYYGQNVVSGQTTLYTANTAIERLLASTATPSVANAGLCLVNSATSITDLTDGQAGQVLRIRATGNTTVKHASGSAATQIELAGNVDYAMVNGDTLTLALSLGGPWYEQARSHDHA